MSKESDEYKKVKDLYITGYIYDKDTDRLEIKTASGNVIVFNHPCKLTLIKVKSVYEQTGAKLAKANKVLNK